LTPCISIAELAANDKNHKSYPADINSRIVTMVENYVAGPRKLK
jgi:hypothetical protein